jgi:hypothetical protein
MPYAGSKGDAVAAVGSKEDAVAGSYLFNTLIIVLFLLNLCCFYDFLYLSSQHHSNNAASCRRIGVMVHMIG